MQLASGKHGLEQVARVHRALGAPRAHNGVQLVYKQQYFALRSLYLVKHSLKTLLKLAAELCARYQRAHVQGEQRAILKVFRHIALGDTLGKPFGYCRFTYARLTYKAGIVFGFTGKYPYAVADFLITAYYRVQLLLPRKRGKILTVFFKGVIGALRIVAAHMLSAPYLLYCIKQLFLRYACGLKHLS